MNVSDIIALGAVLIAALSWIDSVRRVNATAVQFRLEHDPKYDTWFWIRNVGTRSAGFVTVDPASVVGFEAELMWYPDLVPGSAAHVIIKPNGRGEWPKEIAIRFGWRKKRRVIPFHPVRVVADEPKSTD